MPFQSLGLMPELVRALSDKGYTEPTAIQSQAIPAILNGDDVLGGAQTGTGKTAAFTLPILQRLAETPNPKAKGPRVLILVPTRELAVQVHTSIREYGKHIRLRTAVMYGGASMNPQMMALGKGLDILVATPGRLIDHLERGTAQLHRVETLILDEADRMLDMGFLPAIRKILNQVPKQRQTLLFSATFDAPIKQLALQFMRKPVEVQVSSQNTVAHTVNHIAHPVDPGKKRDLLMHILSERYQDQILVFVKTKHLCNRIAEQISKDGIPALAIHGNKSQGQRLKALADFKAGNVRVLCATDVAARGLDIPLLPLVINFDMPMVAEDYVHRIGRTGRAGANGDAVSLVATDEGGLLRAVNRLLKQDIVLEPKPGFEPTTAMRMDLTPPRGKPSGHQPPRRKPAQPGHLKSHGMASQKPKSSSPGGNPRGRQRSPQR
jgi:ATP-dependent RNA helicase RhlE